MKYVDRYIDKLLSQINYTLLPALHLQKLCDTPVAWTLLTHKTEQSRLS